MRWLPALVLPLVVLAGCNGSGDEGEPSPPGIRVSPEQPRDRAPAVTLRPDEPLAGKTVVLDPGHQLGNGRFPSEINRLVDAGGLMKPCNTTGTATDAGYPEATFVWEVAEVLQRKLERWGAEVVLTRDSNSAELWGPCVDERGRRAAEGDLLVSIHGDGNLSPGARGFHVIASPEVEGSQALAEEMRDGLVAEGLETSTYLGSEGLDSRTDLGTLNLAVRPAVMVELGNMRDPQDAALMTSPEGRQRYAAGLLRGIRRHLR
ncbi:N-acetylmuramoyl-L-alanine amidase family protein [Nocardioides alcanivorans]|uniref:N-acetylmuramoyl-L-alanine amidase family protein n=1 Tax=Nocardioides alcanivorans TaxID=2897352 RepID=UPI001F4420A4|nr:N-acetylmuramoyl-L-alanine amidase [Nocardioides alcanivorans]